MARLDPKLIIEAAILSAQKPLAVSELRALFADSLSAKVIAAHLSELQEHWRERGLRLVEVASGWQFVTSERLQPYLQRLVQERAPRYTRAALETLAIIAYRQPVTRGEIEEIRGVALNLMLIRQFEERGWVETVGYRETPGRPALLATTKQFLDDLGLKSLEDLPALEGEEAPDFLLGDVHPDVEPAPESLQKEIDFNVNEQS